MNRYRGTRFVSWKAWEEISSLTRFWGQPLHGGCLQTETEVIVKVKSRVSKEDLNV